MERGFPIGVFDSGVGGLTVARALKCLLPYEVIYYVADTKNFPYGEKTTDQIQEYVTYIVDFLLKKKCKLIVIACNTATSAVYEMCKQWVGDRVAVLNVVDPVIAYVKKKYVDRTIGLIGTNYMVRSGLYSQKLTSIGIQVNALATPPLASIIELEQNFLTSSLYLVNLKPLLHNYLLHPHLLHINALILGCTHYSLIKDSILDFYIQSNRNVEIIDPSTITALFVRDFLIEHQLVNNSTISKPSVFIATQRNDSFQRATQLLCGEEAVLIQS